MASTIPPTVLEWSKGFASLSPGVPPCPGLRPDEWARTHELCTAFITQWGVRAFEMGWDTLRLFGVHPKIGTMQGEWCGCLMPLSVEVHEVTAEWIKLGKWTAYRHQPIKQRGVPVWEFKR